MVAALAACAPVPPAAPAPVAPQITVDSLRARAREQLATGLKLYEAGDYDGAQKNLQASLEHGLLDKADQGLARKHLAFVNCLAGRESACGDEFRRAFEIDPSFSLSAAEDGHPIWGPVYRNVRTQLISEREAAQGKPKVALARAEQLLADGLLKYESGDFPESLRLLESATKEGLRDKADQVQSLKYGAFCLCLLGRYPECRAHFVRIYDIDPNFDLTPAEIGHPSWMKTFLAAKAQAKRAMAGKPAKAKAEGAPSAPKDSGTPAGKETPKAAATGPQPAAKSQSAAAPAATGSKSAP